MHIEVDSHTHTVASGHAYSTLDENIRAASAQGIRLMAATDHGPAMPGAPHIWFFMNLKVLPRIMHGVGVLRGVEANLVDFRGNLDIDEEVRSFLDIVLFSLHEPIVSPTGKSEHTNTVVEAMAGGNVDIFAHGGNPVFPIDVDAVAEAAAHNQVLIEINNSSFTTSRSGSKKNCAALAEAVGRHGGYLTFGTDAHLADKVGVFDECIALIEEVGFPWDRVISRSAVAFLDFLENKGRISDREAFDPLFVN